MYKNELEFIKVIKKLKDNKKFSKTISKNSYNGIKKNTIKIKYFLYMTKLFSRFYEVKYNRGAICNV